MPRVAFIWDVDGVILNTPQHTAWLFAARRPPWRIKTITAQFYYKYVASRTRREGGDNILRLKRVYERLGAESRAQQESLLSDFCSTKNKILEHLIEIENPGLVFPDALDFVLRAKRFGLLQAIASVSTNANKTLTRTGKKQSSFIAETFANVESIDKSLHSVFDVDVCGLDDNKRNLLKLSALELRRLAGENLNYVFFDDSAEGIRIANGLGFYSVAVARCPVAEKLLRKARPDLITNDLREIDINKITEDCNSKCLLKR